MESNKKIIEKQEKKKNMWTSKSYLVGVLEQYNTMVA